MNVLQFDDELLKDINANYVVSGITNFTLEQVLIRSNKKVLNQKAAALEVAGRSKMNKHELVSELKTVILDPYRLKETLIVLESDEYELIQQLLQSESIYNREYMPYKYRFLIDRGILSSIFHNDSFEFFIPYEVRQILAQLDWNQINKIRSEQHEILVYIKSAVNLYGACKPDLIVEIYNGHHTVPISTQKVIELVELHNKKSQSFSTFSGYIVSIYFVEGSLGELYDLLEKSADKPYYIPNKEIFTRYADSLYYEITPQLLKMKQFISKEFRCDNTLADMLMDEIQLMCSMESPIQDVFDELTRRGIQFNTLDEMQKLATLVIDVYNHTRIWSNRGHMPIELKNTINDRKFSYGNQYFNPLKIGRNEPCLCGSGRKYKKCCGI